MARAVNVLFGVALLVLAHAALHAVADKKEACAACYTADGAKLPLNFSTKRCTSSGDPHIRGFNMRKGEISGGPRYTGTLLLVQWYEQEGKQCVRHFVKLRAGKKRRDDEIDDEYDADFDRALDLVAAGESSDAELAAVFDTFNASSSSSSSSSASSIVVRDDERATIGREAVATLSLAKGGTCFKNGCQTYPSGAKVCLHNSGRSVHIDMPKCLLRNARGTCVAGRLIGGGALACEHHTTRTESMTPEPTPNPTPDPTPDPTPVPPEDDFCLQDSRHAARDLCRQAFITRFGPSCDDLDEQIRMCVEDVCLLTVHELDEAMAMVEEALKEFEDELADEGRVCQPATSGPPTTDVPNGKVLM